MIVYCVLDADGRLLAIYSTPMDAVSAAKPIPGATVVDVRVRPTAEPIRMDLAS